MHTIGGMPVRDAKKGITITITAQDIAKGVPKSESSCAAAVAIIRQESCTMARVHLSRIYIKRNGHWDMYNTPGALRNELIVNDRNGEFQPGEYSLKPIPKAQRERRGKAHTLGAPKHGRPGHERKYHVIEGVRPRGANR